MTKLLTDENVALIGYHFCAMLWGCTAIIGKMISYSSILMVWHRMTITFFIYALFPSAMKDIATMSLFHIGVFLTIGVVIATHWVLFYASVKFADSASVALACMGTTAFFSALIEPMALGVPHSLKDMTCGIVVLFGVLMIYFALPHENTGTTDFQTAILCGVVSAFAATLFTVLNKKFIKEASALAISTLEMGAGALSTMMFCVCVYGRDLQWYPHLDPAQMQFTVKSMRSGSWDLVWLLVLAIFCTNIPFLLSTHALHHLSAFTANLIVNLEPIYGIALSAAVFHEDKMLTKGFYVGASVVLAAIFVNPILNADVIVYMSKLLGGSGKNESATAREQERLDRQQLLQLEELAFDISADDKL